MEAEGILVIGEHIFNDFVLQFSLARQLHSLMFQSVTLCISCVINGYFAFFKTCYTCCLAGVIPLNFSRIY